MRKLKFLQKTRHYLMTSMGRAPQDAHPWELFQAISLSLREKIIANSTATRILANELGDMSQFQSERALFSYTGLTPSEHSSGEHKRQGHISRQGKPILRKTLVQCSWVAIRYDKSLREVYERIAARAGGKRAIIAVSRRLIGRLRSCFRNNTLYDSNHSLSTKEMAA